MLRPGLRNPGSIRAGRFVALVLLLHGLVACAATHWEDEAEPQWESKQRAETKAPVRQRPVQQTVTQGSRLSDVYDDWKGTPYRFGGTTRKGIDCSAFTQQAMSRAFGVSLPRTTTQQLRRGVSVDPGMVRLGDLVFFKTGETLNHVGVMMGPGSFMHASTSKGVTISRIDQTYWRSRVVGYRRVSP